MEKLLEKWDLSNIDKLELFKLHCKRKQSVFDEEEPLHELSYLKINKKAQKKDEFSEIK